MPLTARVSRLLYEEADLLDNGRYADWLALLAPDLRYWAPVRADLARTDEREGETSRLPLFDETRETLALRIQRLGTGLAWSEIPPSRTRRLVGNVIVDDDGSGRVRVRSNLLVFRSRSPHDETILCAGRDDRWSHGDKGWRLHERKISVDQRSVENMSLFL
jgi:ethylbenzene dioxygenase beta subunit